RPRHRRRRPQGALARGRPPDRGGGRRLRDRRPGDRLRRRAPRAECGARAVARAAGAARARQPRAAARRKRRSASGRRGALRRALGPPARRGRRRPRGAGRDRVRGGRRRKRVRAATRGPSRRARAARRMSRAGRGGAGGGSGLRLLEARVDGATSALGPALAAAAADAAREDAGRTRRVVATGAGSSAAHARFLASVLVELGVPARFAPLTCFLGEAPPGAAEETLVVFSQGLAPNARLALAHAGAFRTAWLVTSVVDDPAAGDAPSGDRRLASAGDAPGDPASIAERRSFLALARERGL